MKSLSFLFFLNAALATLALGAPFTFSNTGSMMQARNSHTATLLPEGKVLAVGGSDSPGSAEIYDPAKGTWGATGSLIAGRSVHTATLLRSGKVLVAGGKGSGPGYLASAELYDPATGTWTATGAMITSRGAHTATLLIDGRVLVCGGVSGISPIINPASAEIYDPATGTWTATDSLGLGRENHTATLLPNGKVFVAGGSRSSTGTYSPIASAELYDPSTGLWTATSNLTAARGQHTATLLPDGRVLAAAGYRAPDFGSAYLVALTSAEIYNPATGTWSTTGALGTARFIHSATLLPGGKVLVAGGFNGDAHALASAEIYDPATGAWSATGALATARYTPTATLLPSGQVLVAGGFDYSRALASAQLFDPAAGTWSNTGTMTLARAYHAAAPLPDGRVLVAGGNGNSADLYDPAAATWSAAANLPGTHSPSTLTPLNDGRVLALTGGDGSNPALAALYDSASGAWSVAANLGTARFNFSATLLPSGKVLVVGGLDGSPSPSPTFPPVASVELFDPAAGTWISAPSLATARSGHTATVLPNGRVLVAGGFITTGSTASAELYDPATNTWTATGNLLAPRAAHTATLLPSGKVLVAGSTSLNGAVASAELYDPATGTWSATGSLATARYFHTATLLSDGRVLIAAGDDGHTFALASAEVYNPATGLWSTAGTLSGARMAHTATLLRSGKVLVAAGLFRSISTFTTYLQSSELFDAGLGFTAATQPQITGAPSVLYPGSSFALSGVRFQGVSAASSGGGQDSSTNYPLVQLRSLGNEQTAFLRPSATAGWSATSFVSTPVSGFPNGPALVTVFANGIPSNAVLIQVSPVATTSLSSLGREAGGTRVRWREVIAGASYRVEYNDSLTSPWQSFPGAVTANGQGVIEYLDATAIASGPTQRAYRLVTPP